MESLRVSEAPSGESKKDGLKIRLLARDMVIGMPVLGQPAKNAGRAARKVVNSDSRSEEHTSELQSPDHLVCRLLLEKKNKHTADRSGRITRLTHNSLGRSS